MDLAIEKLNLQLFRVALEQNYNANNEYKKQLIFICINIPWRWVTM